MTKASMHWRILLSAALGAMLYSASLCGQEIPPVARKETPSVPAPPPLPPAPVNFRELLTNNTAEREAILAARSPEQRQILRRKLREYESLAPPERDARLCTLQLRLYLRPLMGEAISNRVERLAAVPDPERKLVEERLQFWDQLPPEVQREFLTNEWVLRYIFRPEMARPGQSLPVPGALQQKIENGVQGWNQLPEQKRQEILEHFKRLFELSENEKSKVLNEFSDSDRQRMRKTLQIFERLPRAQRDRCVNGFQRFAELTSQERQQFLNNAERWQSMSVKDRLAWQSLVSRISAPLPPLPGAAKLPPLPPAQAKTQSRLTTTN